MTSATDRVRSPARHEEGIDPGTPDPDLGGGGAGWVELLIAGNDIEAHLLIGRLAEAGVETRTVKDRSGPGAWLHGGSDPWAPVTILVKRVQLEDARLVLAEISWSQPTVDPDDPTASRASAKPRALAWWAAAIALGIAFTSIALARTSGVLNGCEIPLICGGAAETSP